MTTVLAQPATRVRLAYLDNIRIVLTALVLWQHAALTYSTIRIWPYSESRTDGTATLLDVLVIYNQTFFMGMFFLISGYFTPGSYDAKGGARFMRDRFVRLGIPLVVFVVVLRPIFTLWVYWKDYSYLDYRTFYVYSVDTGPMWFVLVLLVFNVVYYMVRFNREQAGRTVPERAPVTTPLSLWWLPLLGLALGVATFVWRIIVPDGTIWKVVGLPTPSFLVQYVAMFVLGIAAKRRGWFDRLPAGAGWAAGCLALVSGYGLLMLLDYDHLSPRMQGGVTLLSLAYSTATMVFAVAMICVVLTAFRTVANRSNRGTTWLAVHGYLVYIIHPPVLVWLAVALAGFGGTMVAKAGLLFALSLVVCWGLAGLIRAIPGADKVV